ncbi:hypothetical protein [Nocardiopsis sp. M1B1]|uniref:hypothetical protein n=1 Tax=Nocardiopsis sp. M1B1 TaxID=3450454 RepID=UPI004039D757
MRVADAAFVRLIGVRRVVPLLVGFASSGLREFFSEVEAARLSGRDGDLDLDENRNLCALDGVLAVGYAIILSLLGMGFYYVAFDLLGIPGGEEYSNLLILAVILFLATAVVETIDFIRVSLIFRIFGASHRLRLMGPLAYLGSFILVFGLIFCFYFVW